MKLYLVVVVAPKKAPSRAWGRARIVVGGLLDMLKNAKNLTKLVKSCEKSIKNRHFFTSLEVEIEKFF